MMVALMADPVNPDTPPRRIVDENVARKRTTDPRLRVGSLVPGLTPTADPLAPPRPVEAEPDAPALLGLPGQDLSKDDPADERFVGERDTINDLPIPKAVLEMGRRGLHAATAAVPGLDLDLGDPTVPVSAPEPPKPPVHVTESAPPMGRFIEPLDPRIEAAQPTARPLVPLDPAIEPAVPRARPHGPSLDPAIERMSPPTRPRAPGAGQTRGRESDAAPTSSQGLSGRVTIGVVVVVGALLAVLGFGARPAKEALSRSDERRLADLWIAKAAPGWGGVRDDEVARAVQVVLASLTRAFADELDGRTPRVLVVDDDIAVQAFALPDATVVVTTAALRRLGSEAQLAALLAHSVAHVVVGDLDAASSEENTRRTFKAALAGGDADAAVQALSQAVTRPSSPERERAVDALAQRGLKEAGWAPEALGDVLRAFGVRGGKARAAWLTQHPDDPARVAAIGARAAGGRTNEGEYAQRILDVVGRLAPTASTKRAAPPTTPTPTTPTQTP
jgi:Zn-dependent protease with chaperone function